jgi:hypothetical protein
MAREHDYEIKVHLDNIQDLFAAPAGDPFSENLRFVSGVEFIKSELNPEMLKPGARTRTTIFLPKEAIEHNLAGKVKDALNRYCQFKVLQNEKTIAALRRDALKALFLGILFLVSGDFLSEILTGMMFSPRFLNTLISDGFSIAFWVMLWRPADFFIFDLSAYGRENKIYKCMMEMEIIVSEEVKSDCG